MSDNKKWFLADDLQPSLYMWVFTQMCLGAVYAAVVFFGVIGVILILRAISFLLPEDPYAALETMGQVATALA
ncbi:Intrinsic membrane protein PufX [Palleronia salina]|uniref:Intrinsic membrane protein PufX n=2 Tax=Palleronia TaxID=315422 RepID=A0A1M6D899_9RHOB|nr:MULTISPECIES: RC-LH1 core complex protein PufX [Palleronia]SEN29149.1 Intrinsic membrane protein PufX [Palleronia pelagia]SHI69380.1 Intrinsic membrane protein PufX [Palleronia salina]